MTSLEAQSLEHPGNVLAQLLAEPGTLGIPGAHHALCGMLAREAGFRALYLSGAALSATLGLPDLGIITQEELCRAVKSLYRATHLPIIVDGDTGYGETLNVMRLVRDLEEAGAAAVQLEDQMLPKKCGHLSNKNLIGAEEMAQKISAAVKARTHLKIVARTDAASESLEEALRRTKLYQQAGADIIFLEANCRGWLGHRICLKHEGKEYQLLRNPLTHSFTLLEENRKELGSIRAESFFSDNYRVELPEDFPFSLILFLSCLALCDSERPMMPVYNSYWYYG